ncbi:DinB family protein [Gilvibacter sp.]|uniref:DinB family protein n=1 Tax=Gilvibacter sp. TaxID=2729997 RepID=UPI0025BCFB1F|nr:DinB family protein [Gilvibacter sp.]NQX77472.1 DinB family protein [Gilvibacter sp.]
MEFSIDTTYKTRLILDRFLENLSLEQLNTVPPNFRNNIFWNIKHVVVTQQLLVYNLSGLPMAITENEVAGYRKGSQVTGDVDQEAVDLLRKQLFSLLDKTRADYNKGLFSRYKEYMVTTGTTLTDVDEAIEFNNFHEGLHLGYVMAIKRALGY